MDFKDICDLKNVDLHVHTGYSNDSFTSPRSIVEFAGKKNKIIAITDHNEIGGALAAKKFDRENRIIIGEEIKTTDLGIEIMAYGIRSKIFPGKAADVVTTIHRQGGTAVLSHPCRRGYFLKIRVKKIPEEIIKSVDGIEVYNARNSESENEAALEMAKKYKKLQTRGSDAHFRWELYLMNRENIILNLTKNILTLFAKAVKKVRRA